MADDDAQQDDAAAVLLADERAAESQRRAEQQQEIVGCAGRREATPEAAYALGISRVSASMETMRPASGYGRERQSTAWTHAEDRDVCPDPEGDRQYDHRRVSR